MFLRLDVRPEVPLVVITSALLVAESASHPSLRRGDPESLTDLVFCDSRGPVPPFRVFHFDEGYSVEYEG